VLFFVAALVGTGATGRGARLRGAHAELMLGARVIDRFRSNSITVSGLTAHSVDVRLLGAIDLRGRAYQWTPYRWQRLRLRRGTWSGVLPAPALLGIYQIQLRLDHGRKLISRRSWLERVFPNGTESRRSFPSSAAVIRHYVARLPGNNVLFALKRLPLPTYDHRDARLHRLFAIAYAPRGDKRRSSRLGRFITTVRDGFHGRWHLLQATIEPPD
jgi:hypothetical protein